MDAITFETPEEKQDWQRGIELAVYGKYNGKCDVFADAYLRLLRERAKTKPAGTEALYDVRITGRGGQSYKINLIRVIREACVLSLREAKEASETDNYLLLAGVHEATAMYWGRRFSEDAGATLTYTRQM